MMRKKYWNSFRMRMKMMWTSIYAGFCIIIICMWANKIFEEIVEQLKFAFIFEFFYFYMIELVHNHQNKLELDMMLEKTKFFCILSVVEKVIEEVLKLYVYFVFDATVALNLLKTIKKLLFESIHILRSCTRHSISIHEAHLLTYNILLAQMKHVGKWNYITSAILCAFVKRIFYVAYVVEYFQQDKKHRRTNLFSHLFIRY